MDNTMILTILGVFIANATMILPLLLWNRSESRNDWRHMDTKFDTYIGAIGDEMKDFHNRLLEIEKNKKN